MANFGINLIFTFIVYSTAYNTNETNILQKLERINLRCDINNSKYWDIIDWYFERTSYVAATFINQRPQEKQDFSTLFLKQLTKCKWDVDDVIIEVNLVLLITLIPSKTNSLLGKSWSLQRRWSSQLCRCIRLERTEIRTATNRQSYENEKTSWSYRNTGKDKETTSSGWTRTRSICFCPESWCAR